MSSLLFEILSTNFDHPKSRFPNYPLQKTRYSWEGAGWGLLEDGGTLSWGVKLRLGGGGGKVVTNCEKGVLYFTAL